MNDLCVCRMLFREILDSLLLASFLDSLVSRLKFGAVIAGRI